MNSSWSWASKNSYSQRVKTLLLKRLSSSLVRHLSPKEAFRESSRLHGKSTREMLRITTATRDKKLKRIRNRNSLLKNESCSIFKLETYNIPIWFTILN